MSRDDGFTVMDVSTDIVNDPKFRRLHRQSPQCVPAACMVYLSVLGESWKHGRRVSVTDAWPVLMTYEEQLVEAMKGAGLLDRKGQIPLRAWIGWFEPANERRKITRERWRRANANRRADTARDIGNTAP